MLFLLLVILSSAYSEDICDLCLCLNEKTTVVCSGKGLITIPQIPNVTQIILLDNNNISSIPNNTFSGTKLRSLDLSDNNITKLYLNSFAGLFNLKSLSLENNNIIFQEDNYPNGVFKDLTSLRYLDLSSNGYVPGLNLTYPDQALKDLVSLENLYLDGIPNLVLNDGFKSLKNLSLLSFTGKCQTNIIYNNSFVNVPNLKKLTLSRCFIRELEEQAFAGFKNLGSLDLSCNRRLGFTKASLALENLKSLHKLDLSAVVDAFAIGIELTSDHVKRIQHLNLTSLRLDHNRIEKIMIEALSYFPESIQEVTFIDNRPTFGYYLIGLNVLKNLRVADVSEQYLSHTPFSLNEFCRGKVEKETMEQFMTRDIIENSEENLSDAEKWIDSTAFNSLGSEKTINHVNNKTHHSLSFQTDSKFKTEKKRSEKRRIKSLLIQKDVIYRNSESTHFKIDRRSTMNSFISMSKGSNFSIPVPPELLFVNVSNSKLGYNIPKLQFGPNKIKQIDISINILPKWFGPVLGAQSIEILDLSNNYCDHISNDFFMDFSNLKSLSVASNFLELVIAADTSGQIFSHLTNLEVIDLSDTKLRDIPSKLLQSQKRMKKILISRNPIKSWTIKIDHMEDLEYIDASYDLLSSLPIEMRNLADRQHRKNRTMSINLKGQILQCSCSNLDFLIWMNKKTVNFIDRDNYTCYDYKDNIISMNDLDSIIVHLQKHCASYTLLTTILTCGLIFIITLVVVSFLYKYRWKLRYLYYLTRSKFRGYSAIGGAAQNRFDFDAFISYADEDRRLVVLDMVKKLEEEQGTQLCIHHRDFLAGEEIAANILNAVRNSKKTVIVLSRNFIASYWCIYELNMAYMESLETGRNVIILVIYEHIPVKDLPEILVEFMKKNCYIEYTDDQQGNIIFWDNLHRAISSE